MTLSWFAPHYMRVYYYNHDQWNKNCSHFFPHDQRPTLSDFSFLFYFLGYYLGSLVLGIISINMMLITPLTVKWKNKPVPLISIVLLLFHNPRTLPWLEIFELIFWTRAIFWQRTIGCRREPAGEISRKDTDRPARTSFPRGEAELWLNKRWQ
jgi:hypothetical protein